MVHPQRKELEEFIGSVEPRLRIALTAAFGQDGGQDAAAAALAYGWEHWDRVSVLEHPVGYLYRVGLSSQRRHKEPRWTPVPEDRTPHIEPALPEALEGLSEKQRLAVVLVHAYGWSRLEVADLAQVSLSSLDTHLSRGLSKLRAALGVGSNA